MSVTTALHLADPELSQAVLARLEVVEERLRHAVGQQDALADASSRHLVNAGGKRLRPLLTLLAAQLGDPDRPEVIDAAIVVELTHLATLYHDDVMDDAPLRRGAPSAHEVWGNTVAILTGDLLFARASTTVAGLGPTAVRIQAKTFERLCLGQLHETVGPRAGEDPVDHYLQVLADKTGSLIATSARFGAMFGGASPAAEQILTAYGEKVGVAFQLSDDVIDLVSDAAVTGKTPGTDLREHVPTMPALLLRRLAQDRSRTAEVALARELDGDLSDEAHLAQVVAQLRDHEVVDMTRRLAQAWAGDAKALLAPLPAGPVKTALLNFTDALVDRAC